MAMPLPQTRVREYRGVDEQLFRDEIAPRYEPALLRGLVAEWPAVAAAASTDGAVDYLARFDAGATAEAFVGQPEIKGRFFYGDDMAGFNFTRRKGPFRDIIRYIAALAGEQAGDPTIYVGAAAIPECLPGFDRDNHMPLAGPDGAVPRIWIGNRTEVSTHFDLSHNLACVVAGRRRFILFPPDQLPNLYVGPLDHNMAGQPTSMVPVHDPDPERWPRFATALEHAQVAELEPGDAIYVPTLWWHHVDALTPFNILINYWWEPQAADAGSPFEALVHAILSIKHLPEPQREAWRTMFNHYVFHDSGEPAAHLPAEHRGILGQPTAELRRRIRQFLLRGLGRG
jgi:hypothetical protein